MTTAASITNDFEKRTKALERKALADLDRHLGKTKDAHKLAERAIVRLRLGDLDGAQRDADEAVTLDENVSLAWSARATTHCAAKRYEATIADCDRAIGIDVDDARAHAYRALASYHRVGPVYPRDGMIRELSPKTGDVLDRALADLDRVLALHPIVEMLVLRAQIHGDLGNWTNAERDLDQAIRLKPRRRQLRELRGELAEERIKYELARRLSVEDDAPSAQLLARAQSRIDDNELDLARADVDAVLRLEPTNAAAYGVRGLIAHRTGDLDAAIDAFSKAIELDPEDAISAYNRGYAYHRKREYASARASYQLAVAREPTYTDAWINLASTHRNLGDYRAALDAIEHAVELDPSRGIIYTARAQAYIGLGQWDRVVENYTLSIAYAPEDLQTYAYRGQVEQKRGNFAAAIADFEHVCTVDPRTRAELAPVIAACRAALSRA